MLKQEARTNINVRKVQEGLNDWRDEQEDLDLAEALRSDVEYANKLNDLVSDVALETYHESFDTQTKKKLGETAAIFYRFMSTHELLTALERKIVNSDEDGVITLYPENVTVAYGVGSWREDERETRIESVPFEKAVLFDLHDRQESEQDYLVKLRTTAHLEAVKRQGDYDEVDDLGARYVQGVKTAQSYSKENTFIESYALNSRAALEDRLHSAE